MPLSTVCVSTVTGRPKAWSSYTNLPKSNSNVQQQKLRTMNSTEELTTAYNNHNRKPAGYFEYDFTDEKPAKKDKKWSFGNLFRRKKKVASSSDEDVRKIDEKKKTRKNETKKKNNNNLAVTFDHVISSQLKQQQPQIVYHKPNSSLQDIPREQHSNFETQHLNARNHPNQLSLDSFTRKNRSRELAKFRAEARRTSFNNNTSSDEDSTSSQKFRSDDSLQTTLNKRSRAARTERYLKRHSRDGENPNNYLRISKSDAESSSLLKLSDDSCNKSPSPQFLPNSDTPALNYIGLSTIPPSHFNYNYKINNCKPPVSIEHTAVNKLPRNQYNNRSISFDADIHMPCEEIVHGRLELGRPRMRNFTLNDSTNSTLILKQLQPPAPPPRDICRRLQQNDASSSLKLNTKYFKSSSEDHLPSKETLILAQRPQSTTPEPKTRWYRPTGTENYQYLTDKQPRSRKPIFIQNNPNILEQTPQMFKAETRVEQKIFLPSVVNNNNIETNSNDNEIERKSTNLEEALNELEEIYNSLKLGDENLLELAEKRENEVVQEELERKGKFPVSVRGAMSDSGFNYEPYDSTRRKKRVRKLLESDDMAFRKNNRDDRAATINDPQNVASKISYLLTNPIYSSEHFRQDYIRNDPNEPDVTLDDVLYRTIKQSNKLKVPEHPPPFGIPLGPITLASNSDYLHAIPTPINPKPSRVPDLVKDDLAYRNLRKDNAKEAALPPVSDDLKNNNFNIVNIYDSPRLDLAELKKRRAVRSKSANIGSLISQEVIERASRRNARDKNQTTNECKTLSDIADAMQIARQVLKEKEMKHAETKRGSLSDTDTLNSNLKYARYLPVNRKNTPPKTITENEKVEEFISKFDDVGIFRTSSFEDALTALAIEAKEASDKFTQQIEELDQKQSEELLEKSEHDYENLATSDEGCCNDNNCNVVVIENKAEPDGDSEPIYDNLGEHRDSLGEETNSNNDDVDVASFNKEITTNSNSSFKKLSCSESLKSPKLVLETSKLKIDSNVGRCENNGNILSRNCSNIRRNRNDELKSSNAWHNNPTTAFAIACGLACFHELISLDFFAFFSIIFAILTFISTFFT